jgi:hypothetical protein
MHRGSDLTGKVSSLPRSGDARGLALCLAAVLGRLLSFRESTSRRCRVHTDIFPYRFSDRYSAFYGDLMNTLFIVKGMLGTSG